MSGGSDSRSSAIATGGAGGSAFELQSGGDGGGADANSSATSSGAGIASSSANATGGAGGEANSNFPNSSGGDGGDATAMANASTAGSGTAIAKSIATAGAGSAAGSDSQGGNGGDARAIANATAAGGGTALAQAIATGGVSGGGRSPGFGGFGGATSNAETTKGALAQAQSTAVGPIGEAQSTATTRLAGVSVQSSAASPTGSLGFGSMATTNTIAQGGAGQAFVDPGQTAYAFSTALPDKAYAASLIDGATNVAGALLGPRDMVFGTAILGANYATDGGGVSPTYSGSATFDFGYGGDLMLGLIDDQDAGFPDGLGFQSMEFTILDNGVEILDLTFESLAVAESFFHDSVINLGSNLGPDINLTFGYNLVADGSGGFGFDFAIGGAVPETSTWTMMLVGFAGLGFAGYRASRKSVAVTV